MAALLHIFWPAVFLPDSAFTPSPPPLLAAMISAALAVIIRPTSVWQLLRLAAVQVVVVVYHLPFVSNHWLLSGFVSLAAGTGPAETFAGPGLRLRGGRLCIP